MQENAGGSDTLKRLQGNVSGADIPQGLRETLTNRLVQMKELENSPAFLPELDRMVRYVDYVVNLPWNKRTEDILDLKHAQEILDQSHYGLQQLKERVLEYMSILQLGLQQGKKTSEIRAPIMMFVGLVGTGKTTIASSIAEAMGRKFIRISFRWNGRPFRFARTISCACGGGAWENY